jgi:hypothetical protein
MKWRALQKVSIIVYATVISDIPYAQNISDVEFPSAMHWTF